MSKSYQPWTQDQQFLLPPSLRDWLPEGHLAWFVLDVVSQLDLSPIVDAIQSKDARGQRPYHPQMMMAVLVYGYCTGVFSSRKIERATYEDVAFRVIAGNAQPYFTTINEFRRVHREHFARLFAEVLRLCRGAGLVKLGHVAIDGTKVRANASKHKAMSYERMCEQERRLVEQVEELLSRADTADAQDDERYGAGRRDEDLPEELRRREQRLARIGEAKRELEAEARRQRAADLREQAEGMEETARAHTDPSMGQRLRTKAANARRQADELDPPSDDCAPLGGGGAGELARRPGSTTPDATPKPSAQRNFTDPDSCIMKGGDGFMQAYNAQLAVDEHCQVIVATGVTDQAADNANLTPMLERIAGNLGEVPSQATGDTGYWHPRVAEQARALGCEALVATGRRRHGECGVPSAEGEPPEGLDALQRMRWRLNTAEGRRVYARRKAVVEPVNGQVKGAQGFRRFSFRGLQAVEAEWNLVCLCHNALKLFRHGEVFAARGA
ncbi:MAG: IS1182 family transposase [Myxococcota bacterium]